MNFTLTSRNRIIPKNWLKEVLYLKMAHISIEYTLCDQGANNVVNRVVKKFFVLKLTNSAHIRTSITIMNNLLD